MAGNIPDLTASNACTFFEEVRFAVVPKGVHSNPPRGRAEGAGADILVTCCLLEFCMCNVQSCTGQLSVLTRCPGTTT